VRYGNQVAMATHHAEQLKHFSCETANDRIPVHAVFDLPFKVHLKCHLPWEGEPLSSFHLKGLLDGVPISAPISLCVVSDIPSGLPHTPTAAVCTQPLFLGPGLSPLRLIEWIEYHLILGMSHVYIYDRDDTLQELLAYHVRMGVVTRHVWWTEPRGRNETYYLQTQQMAQDACLMRHGPSHTWLAYLDPDEFLSLNDRAPGSISRYLRGLDEVKNTENAAQVMIQNVFMGGKPELGTKLLVEQFIMSAGRMVYHREKPLVHCASTKFMWAHFASRLKCGSTVMANPIRIKALHYMTSDDRQSSDLAPTEVDRSATWIVPHLRARMGKWETSNTHLNVTKGSLDLDCTTHLHCTWVMPAI